MIHFPKFYLGSDMSQNMLPLRTIAIGLASTFAIRIMLAAASRKLTENGFFKNCNTDDKYTARNIDKYLLTNERFDLLCSTITSTSCSYLLSWGAGTRDSFISFKGNHQTTWLGFGLAVCSTVIATRLVAPALNLAAQNIGDNLAFKKAPQFAEFAHKLSERYKRSVEFLPFYLSSNIALQSDRNMNLPKYFGFIIKISFENSLLFSRHSSSTSLGYNLLNFSTLVGNSMLSEPIKKFSMLLGGSDAANIAAICIKDMCIKAIFHSLTVYNNTAKCFELTPKRFIG